MSTAGSRRPTLAERFRYFVPVFTAGPAPLYAHLARSAAEQLEGPGPNPFRRVLMEWDEEPPRRFLPLRLLAVVHRWVLAGELPALAPYYRSAGGIRPPEGSWPKFHNAILERSVELPELLAPPLQHNEPSRAAALTTGFLQVAVETGLPLRLLEVGTSAGLLLRWDHYPTHLVVPEPCSRRRRRSTSRWRWRSAVAAISSLSTRLFLRTRFAS